MEGTGARVVANSYWYLRIVLLHVGHKLTV